MAIVNTIAKSLGAELPTFGGPPAVTLAGGGNTGLFAQAIAVVVNAATTNVVFNTFPGPGTLRWAWIRVKTTSVNGATTITWKVTGTDGTTTQQLVAPSPVTAAGTNIDNNAFIYTDLNLTSITVALTSGVNTATYDVEIAGGV